MKPIVITGPAANTGKTELACRIVAALGDAQALKITRFHRESHCPVHGVDAHGDDNCDGCDESPSGFELVTDAARLNVPGKDTQRLIEAGAKPALWLRAAPHVFEYALQAALKHFDLARPLVIEGNSAANVASFEARVVLLWPSKSRGVKESVLAALARCDDLLLVEEEGQPSVLPASLLSACAKAGVRIEDLPEPTWLKARWWLSGHEPEGWLKRISSQVLATK
jgi:hypothetical protein